MTNYIFLLELYFILTVLTFLYPKEVQKRNHIVNAILMAILLMGLEFGLPSGMILSVDGFIESAISRLPSPDMLVDPTLNQVPRLKEKFIESIAVPIAFFFIGRTLFYFNKISLNTFDTLYTGLFPFVVWFDLALFLGIKGLGGLIWHYLFFFIAYGIVSYFRIEFFIFFGIKNIIDDRSFNV